MNPIAQRLVDAGLLQFGVFIVDGREKPFQTTLEMLPSYPDILRIVKEELLLLVDDADYLVATADAVPIGVALSLALNRPLVYSRGGQAEPVFDFVGAYDIGHSAALVTTVIDEGWPQVERLAAVAKRVGLDVERVLAVLHVGNVTPGMEVLSLVTLADIVDDMAQTGWLPVGQAEAVREWLGK